MGPLPAGMAGMGVWREQPMPCWPSKKQLKGINGRRQSSAPRDNARAVAQLILKRASASRLSGEWKDDDYDVIADGAVVGRIMKGAAAPLGSPWLWTLAFGHHENRAPTHGYEPTREAAMAAFAKSWRREA